MKKLPETEEKFTVAKAKVRMTKQICLEFMFFDTDNPRR